MVNTPEKSPSAQARGGVDLTLTYTREQYAAIGADDAAELLDQTDSALWALAALRSPGRTWGEGYRYAHGADAMDWSIAIGDLTRLAGSAQALLQHALAQHAAAGGSIGQAAAAMGTPRSTAQDRIDAARQVTARPGPVNDWVLGPAADANRARQ